MQDPKPEGDDYPENTMAHLDPTALNPQVMHRAGAIIRDGGLVAFPTETVYGLGADALNEAAVAGIYRAKERPANDPIIVHIAALDDLWRVARDVPEAAQRLAERFWPGPLTLVLARHPDVPLKVTAGRETVAVRWPAHPVAQALLEAAGTPIAAPSANRFARPSPTRAEHVLDDLGGRVAMILDAGATAIGLESTILDLSGATPTVLRPGGVSLEDLRELLPDVVYQPRYLNSDDEAAPAPGTLLKHYSPNAQVMVFTGPRDKVLQTMRLEADQLVDEHKNVGVMMLDGDAEVFSGLRAQVALLGEDADAMANKLFAGLRDLDRMHVDVILVRAPDQAGLGLALWDRLMRAAEGRVIEV